MSDEPAADRSGSVAGFADAAGRFLPLVCTLNAARVLSSMAATLGVDLAELDRLARAGKPGADGIVFLPYLDGERTPNLPDATGTLLGLRRDNMSPENLARAAVEGMLAGLSAGVGELAKHGVDARRVVLIGGAAESLSVQEAAAYLFGRPVEVPAPAEYVALGAARQAAWTLSGGAGPPRWRHQATLELEAGPCDLAAGEEIWQAHLAARRQIYGL